MRFVAVLAWCAALLLAAGCERCSGQSSSSGGSGSAVAGSVVLTSVSSSAFPPRSRASCAADLSQSPPSGGAAVYVLGGFSGASGGVLYNDVWLSTAASFAPSAPPPFVRLNQSAASPFPRSVGGAAAYLLNGALLQFGGQDGVVGNDVFTSQDGGATWPLVTLNAAWSSRSLFASCVLPGTDIVLIAAGQLSSNAPSPPFNSSDVWTSQDGAGAVWSQSSSSAPFGAVLSAAAVGLYDHTIVLCGGQRNGSYLNEVWLSEDLGRTWLLQQANAQWPARWAHTLSIDGDDIVYLIGGAAGSATAAPLDVWATNSHGLMWHALQVSAASPLSVPSSVLYGCSFIRAASGGVRQLIVYSGEDATGAAVGVLAANLSVALAPASSTAVALASSASVTAKPPLPSSSATTAAGTSSSSARAASASGSASSSSSSSSSGSTGSTRTNGCGQRSVAAAASVLLSYAVAAMVGCM